MTEFDTMQELKSLPC